MQRSSLVSREKRSPCLRPNSSTGSCPRETLAHRQQCTKSATVFQKRSTFFSSVAHRQWLQARTAGSSSRAKLLRRRKHLRSCARSVELKIQGEKYFASTPKHITLKITEPESAIIYSFKHAGPASRASHCYPELLSRSFMVLIFDCTAPLSGLSRVSSSITTQPCSVNTGNIESDVWYSLGVSGGRSVTAS